MSEELVAMRDVETWACHYCGASGRLSAGRTFDEMQCPDCGEPVYPG